MSGLALVVAGFALMALAVALNGVLRLEGLGGEGLSGAAGVLGGALVLLGRAEGALQPVGGEAHRIFSSLELAGFALLAVWIARAGWELRRLVAPAGVTGPISLAAAAAAALLAAAAFFHATASASATLLARTLPFLPVALWSVVLAGLGLFGPPSAPEPPE